jgi:hypothetical protein
MSSPEAWWRRETAAWSYAEDLEYRLEGIGRAPEETLHGLDSMWSAILDEGDDFEGLDEDEVEAAISVEANEW